MPTELQNEAPRRTSIEVGPAMTELEVTGMTCGNCARHVTEALQGVPGVQAANVALDAHRASIRWQGPPNPSAAVQAVRDAGFEARVAEKQEPGANRVRTWQLTLWVGVLGTLPLMLGEWVFGLGTVRWFQWFSLVVATVVQVFAGAQFYRGAWNQLKRGQSNMDLLVALGSSTAYLYSLWALLSSHGGHLYFMEAAAIISLISLGHWLESRVSARASSALAKLLHLAPETARRQNPDGSDTEVAVSQLLIGDLVRLGPGDRIPTDGVVEEGQSAVDQAMLTGESVPVDKTPADELFAGTLVVNGRLLMRVTATGEATALAHIILAVQRAQNSRANIQRLGDRVSSVFVPAIVLVAIAAGLGWGLAPEAAREVHAWLGHYLWPAHIPDTRLAAACIIAASVLIIACPCAMGLATPAAIMAGSNAAAQAGILIRDGVALERAGQVTAVLLDKTGTLTTGKLDVVQVWEKGTNVLSGGASPVAEPLNAPRPLAQETQATHLAASLARHSMHPISQAIARLASGEVTLADWKELRGNGVMARMPESARAVRLGSLRWLRELGIDLDSGQSFIQQWSSQGATLVGLADGESLAALFAVKDTLKPGAQRVIEQLHRQGFETYLVTGDLALSAQSIAKQAGIAPDHVFAEVLPEQKAGLVQKLQSQGARVAFVGDGINDAPALEQADLGIAVSRASDIAREAADIILLNSEIEAVPESLGLARATLRTIKQNLFWAFFYNGIGVPLAALGFMSPILCAAAMGLSDTIVIGNALRLRRWRLRD